MKYLIALFLLVSPGFAWQGEGRCVRGRSGRLNRVLRWRIDRSLRFLWLAGADAGLKNEGVILGRQTIRPN
jgi:hypothetical protein